MSSEADIAKIIKNHIPYFSLNAIISNGRKVAGKKSKNILAKQIAKEALADVSKTFPISKFIYHTSTLTINSLCTFAVSFSLSAKDFIFFFQLYIQAHGVKELVLLPLHVLLPKLVDFLLCG